MEGCGERVGFWGRGEGRWIGDGLEGSGDVVPAVIDGSEGVRVED
jgi:hypothetical protein